MGEVKNRRFLYSLAAKESIRRLHPTIKPIIKREIERLSENQYLGKELVDELAGFRSLVIGRYRVIYCFNESTATLGPVDHASCLLSRTAWR
jgi:mRNA-degrading endonuclease RelE of RelBE toxin-antitoxin system